MQDEGCNLFDPVFTDMGICYAFNAAPTMTALRSDSPYARKMDLVFNKVLGEETPVRKGVGSGRYLGFDFYLNSRHKPRSLYSPGLTKEAGNLDGREFFSLTGRRFA